jgi:hypothetical protein
MSALGVTVAILDDCEVGGCGDGARLCNVQVRFGVLAFGVLVAWCAPRNDLECKSGRRARCQTETQSESCRADAMRVRHSL